MRFARSIAYSPQAYYDRLEVLVLKYHAGSHPHCRRVAVIPNGVAMRRNARACARASALPGERADRAEQAAGDDRRGVSARRLGIPMPSSASRARRGAARGICARHWANRPPALPVRFAG
jgi:hypothetical protein